MANYLSLGQGEPWQSLSSMQPGDMYWVISDSISDIDEAAYNIIRSLPVNDNSAFIGIGSHPDQLLSKLTNAQIHLMPLFSLPSNKTALISLTSDINRTNFKRLSHFILHIPSSDIWKQFTTTQLEEWLQTTTSWLKKQSITLLILQYDQEPEILIGRLGAFYYSIGGKQALSPNDTASMAHCLVAHTDIHTKKPNF